jgi:hypothetical protein
VIWCSVCSEMVQCSAVLVSLISYSGPLLQNIDLFCSMYDEP